MPWGCLGRRRELHLVKYWRIGDSTGASWWAIDDGTSPYRIVDDHGGLKTTRDRINTAVADIAPFFGSGTLVQKTQLGPGEFHPRVYRPPGAPRIDDFYTREWASSVQAVRNLLVGMRNAFRFVEPSTKNDDVFGHEMRQLLILASTEVESSCKAVLKANNYPAPANGRWTTNDYVKVLGPLHLDEWEIALRDYPDYPRFKPFVGWNSGASTKSLWWYETQNDVKHDRETLFDRATFKSVLWAMGGAFIIVNAQFGQFGRRSMQVYETDEFYVTKQPAWPLSEHYVPLKVGGVSKWSPVNLKV